MMKINLLDVAVGPMIAFGVGYIIALLLTAAAVTFAIIMIVRAIRKNKKGKQK